MNKRNFGASRGVFCTGALVLFSLMASGGAFATTSNLSSGSPAQYTPDVSYTLRTSIGRGGMSFIGVGGKIDGVVNPTLRAREGDIVQITLIDGDGAEHDISVPRFGALSSHVLGQGASTTVVFRAGKSGVYNYFCTLPGHRAAGMEGKIIVGEEREATASSAPQAPSIVRVPTELPAPVGDRAPQTVKVNLITEEVTGALADGVNYTYWTYNGKVPGPMIRVRTGDTVQLTLSNSRSSRMIHSIDLHAVIGPGGGSAVLQVPPGKSKTLIFKATRPGLFVYHCATPMVAEHISNGMFGMILVEPPGGLPKVDREFYVMQNELYTTGSFGSHGHQDFDVAKLLAEQPTYMVFNGSVGALTTQHPLTAKVGDTVRIFFGDAGPNLTSSFHVIGEIMDDVWAWGSLSNPPLRDIQTISVPPGGAVISQFKVHVPGRYILVDHALGRMEQGLAGYLQVSGPPNPALYRSSAGAR